MGRFGSVRSIFSRTVDFESMAGAKVFHHMPKCGGTALQVALAEWFNLVPDYITVAQLVGEEPVAPPLDLQALEQDHCVCGHFECRYNHLRIRYPEVLRNRRRHFLFSFVRDPLDLSFSLYYHAVKVGRLDPQFHSLLGFVDKQRNYMAKRFSCTRWNYRRVLDRYDFIGLQEEMPLSMEKLAALLGREPVRVPLRNTSPRDQQETALAEEVVLRFKARNALDYAIYDYVRTKYFR